MKHVYVLCLKNVFFFYFIYDLENQFPFVIILKIIQLRLCLVQLQHIQTTERNSSLLSTEWSSLIGPDQSRYSALIGWHLTLLAGLWKPHKAYSRRHSSCMCCYGKDLGTEHSKLSTNQSPVSGLVWTNERAALWMSSSVEVREREGGAELTLSKRLYPSSQTPPVYSPHWVCPVPPRQTVFRHQKGLVHTSLDVL